MPGMLELALGETEARALIGCLEREIARIEQGQDAWKVYEPEYRSTAAKLRELLPGKNSRP
jgi:hypothetical protein